jgi:hypothetical protein
MPINPVLMTLPMIANLGPNILVNWHVSELVSLFHLRNIPGS